MDNRKLYTLIFSLTLMAAVLLACGGPTPEDITPPPETPTPPAEATVNGVSKIDRENGTAELSVSALETDGSVRSSGQVSGPTADVDQPGFTVSAGVCEGGGITSLGPVTAALTFDATPSLTGCLFCDAANDPFDENGDTKRRQGGLDFIERMPDKAQVAISYFNDEIGFTNTQTFSGEKDSLRQAVQDATSPAAIGSGTNLWDASVETINLLGSVAGENRIAIIFTDGGDTTRSDPVAVEDAASQAGVRVFYIGLGSATNEEAMQNIAGATNPEGLYISSEDTSELVNAFKGVANSSQASGCIDLGFSPVPTPGQTVTGSLSFTIDGGQFTRGYKVGF